MFSCVWTNCMMDVVCVADLLQFDVLQRYVGNPMQSPKDVDFVIQLKCDGRVHAQVRKNMLLDKSYR